MIALEIPGRAPLTLAHAVFDVNGTMATDGRISPSVVPLWHRLQALIPCYLISADTHGTLDAVAIQLQCPAYRIKSGEEKAQIVQSLAGSVVTIGNGYNDVPMFQVAALSIAVLGPEGCAAALFREADVVVKSVHHALRLLLSPSRLRATLRP